MHSDDYIRSFRHAAHLGKGSDMSELPNIAREIKYAQELTRVSIASIDDNTGDPADMSVYASAAIAQAQISIAVAIADLASAIRESKED